MKSTWAISIVCSLIMILSNPLSILGDRSMGVLTSGNAPEEGFLTWYSVKSPLFPHPTRGVGEWGMPFDRYIDLMVFIDLALCSIIFFPSLDEETAEQAKTG